MNVSENVNNSISDVSKHFLNELSGTVAVITSDGRMIVVRLLFFIILFLFLKAFHHANKKNPTCQNIINYMFKPLQSIFLKLYGHYFILYNLKSYWFLPINFVH